jgi:hypothetical protein
MPKAHLMRLFPGHVAGHDRNNALGCLDQERAIVSNTPGSSTQNVPATGNGDGPSGQVVVSAPGFQNGSSAPAAEDLETRVKRIQQGGDQRITLQATRALELVQADRYGIAALVPESSRNSRNRSNVETNANHCAQRSARLTGYLHKDATHLTPTGHYVVGPFQLYTVDAHVDEAAGYCHSRHEAE